MIFLLWCDSGEMLEKAPSGRRRKRLPEGYKRAEVILLTVGSNRLVLQSHPNVFRQAMGMAIRISATITPIFGPIVLG